MILVIDVGNTNLVLGCMEEGRKCFSARLASDVRKTAEEYALLIGGILQMHGVSAEEIEGGILSSVVPYLRTVVPEAVRLLTGHSIPVVGSGIRTGLNIRVDDPAAVGSDLIVGAVAAKAKYPAPIAVIDMGTATTLTVIGPKGEYEGGMIIPGFWTSLNALSESAAQLPYIDPDGPVRLIGKNTVDCMRAGSVIGCAAMLDGLLERLEEELGTPVSAVLTGGVSHLVAPHCRHRIHEEPDLLLDGLALLYKKNSGPGQK